MSETSPIQWMLETPDAAAEDRAIKEPELKKIEVHEVEGQEIIMLVGNVGTGKSTLARELAEAGAVVVCYDDIVAMIAGGRYVYDTNKRAVYKAAELAAIRTALRLGRSVVIDRTNIDRATRAAWFNMVRCRNLPVVAHDFGPGDEATLARRLAANRGTDAATWRSVHERLRTAYQPPTTAEGFARVISHPGAQHD